MSQRALIRSIAKARLRAMEVSHVNKVMGLGLAHTKQQNWQRTFTGRRLLAKICAKHMPVWRKVIFGPLAKDGYHAQMGIGGKRRYRAVQSGAGE